MRYKGRERSDLMITGLTENYNRAIANANSEEDLTSLLNDIKSKGLFDAKDAAYFKTEIEYRRRELNGTNN